MGHHIVDTATGGGFRGRDKSRAFRLPSRPLGGVIGYGRKRVRPLRIFSVHGGTADSFNASCALSIGDHAYDIETTAHGAAQAVIAGTG